MPSVIIHEKVGHEIGKKINISSYDYYLGLLAPDAPSLEGFASKEERWTSHKRAKDYTRWRENLNNFYEENKHKFNKDFLLGYYIHILTDIVYDDLLYLDVRDTIMNEGITKEDSHNIMRSDMDKYYFSEIEDIKEILEKGTNSYDILNIDKDKLYKFRKKSIDEFQSTNNSVFITNNIIEVLTNEVFKELNIYISYI